MRGVDEWTVSHPRMGSKGGLQGGPPRGMRLIITPPEQSRLRLNRPGIVQLRAADESFYVILQIQCPGALVGGAFVVAAEHAPKRRNLQQMRTSQ